MMFSEAERRFWQKMFDGIVKFYKTRDPKVLESLKESLVFIENGHIVDYEMDTPEEAIAHIERMMKMSDPFLEEDREKFKKKYGQEIKEQMKEYMKNNPDTYHVTIMENKAIRVIEIPEGELRDILEYWALVETFYETKDLKYLDKILDKYFIDTNGETHFPEENPLFILINFDKLKSEIDKFSM